MAEIGVGVREGGGHGGHGKRSADTLRETTNEEGWPTTKVVALHLSPLFPPPSLPLVVPVPTAAAADALIGRPGRSEIKSGRWSAGLLSERLEQQQNKKLKRRDKKQKPSGAEGP